LRQPKKILVAPLGWGLGHATRCIPIIELLLREGAEVAIASDGRALALLRQTFPHLKSHELPGYGIQYRSESMIWNMAIQLPRIFWAIFQEHRKLSQIVQMEGIDGIISDNRFGFFYRRKPCVFITHQVNILTPFRLLSFFVNKFNYLIISRFNECWIPDVADSPNLSGALSHPIQPYFLKKKTKYLGALSRFQKAVLETPKVYDAVAVLSGPEPQRSRLESALIAQAKNIRGKILIVQGKPEMGGLHLPIPLKNLEIVPSLPLEELENAIAASEVFIGRSGYSTVMDLARLGKRALLIPTPGQTEQEYLAEKLLDESVFFTQKQHELDIETGIAEAKKRSGLQGDFFDKKSLTTAIESFLRSC